MPPVFRVEAHGESAVPYPTLASAMRLSPRHSEAYIATSLEGVHLADAIQHGGPGGIYGWVLTHAGRDVSDWTGWSAEAPTLSRADVETVLALALDEDLAPLSEAS